MAASDEIRAIFEFLGLNPPSDDRVSRIAAQIDAGERNLLDVRNDLMAYMAEQQGVTLEEFTGNLVRQIMGDVNPDAQTTDTTVTNIVQQLLGNQSEGDLDTGLTFADFRRSLQGETGDGGDIYSPPTTIGDSTIPSGGRLIEITDPSGADASSLFRVVYSWNGVEYAYEIGDRARFDQLFGKNGISGFNEYQKIDQAAWDEQGIYTVGNIDERLGATESEASLMEREFRAAGYEALPGWWDEEVTTLYIIGTAEGWSVGRLAKSISETEAFKGQYPGLDDFMSGRRITDVISATTAYEQERQQLQTVLRRYRGPNTDTSNEYLGQLIATGWTATQIDPVVQAEKLFRENPASINELNEILAYSGLDVVDENGFIDVMTGNAVTDVYEAINDTLRRQALAEAGVDIDAAFAESLGVGQSDSIMSPLAYTQQAQQAAASIARNFNNISLDRFGLAKEDIVAAVFGEESPTGKDAGEISSILRRLESEATASAGGYAGASSYIDARGRLRIQGFNNQ